MEEIWKPVKGYEQKYLVSNRGNIKSLDSLMPNPLTGGKSIKKGQSIKPWLDRGYPRVGLVVSGQHKFVNVHRLVAFAFLPLVEGKNYINHKDGNRANNCVENLEWCTQKENVNHAEEILYRTCRPLVLNTQTGVYYTSIKQATQATYIKYSISYLCYMLSGKVKNKTNLIYC